MTDTTNTTTQETAHGPARLGIPRTRVDRAVTWVGWHWVELAGVFVPAGFAVTATPWLWLASAAVAAAWAAHELRIKKEEEARAERALPAGTTAAGTASVDTPETGEVAG